MSLSNQTNPASPVNDMFGDDDNIIINGDCAIAQAGNSIAAIGSGGSGQYAVDCINLQNQVSTAVLTFAQVSDHPILGPQGYSIKATVTTNDAAVAAADRVIIRIVLEGNQIAKIFRDSTTDYCPLALSFWAKHNLGVNAGLPVTFGSSNFDRVFPSWINLQSGAWIYCVVPIVSTNFATGGTWNINPPNANGGGIVEFALMAGSNFTGATPDQWNSAGTSQLYPTGVATNFCATIGNTLQLADIKLQRGMIGTLYRRKSFALQLAECQRYYWQSFQYGTTPVQNIGNTLSTINYFIQVAGATTSGLQVKHPVTMRATPTVTGFNPQAANNKWRNTGAGADSGTPAFSSSSGTDYTLIQNPQVAGDAAGQNAALHATFNSRL